MRVSRLLTGLALLASTGGHAWAQAASPSAPVATLDQGLNGLLAGGTAKPFVQRFAQIAPAVDQAFDLTAILQSVVGPRWASLPADQQQKLLAAFRRYTIANYVANFSDGEGTVIKMLPGTQAAGGGQMVSTQIAPKTGDPTKINYLVKQGAKGWQVTDIYLDGTISQVAVQRSDFRSLLASGEGAQPLIQQLDKKVSDLSGGAVKP